MPKLSLHRNLVSRFNIGPLFVTRNIIVQSMFIFKNSPPREPSSPQAQKFVLRVVVGALVAVVPSLRSQAVSLSSHPILARIFFLLQPPCSQVGAHPDRDRHGPRAVYSLILYA